jgi:hypothetical protein
LVAYEELDHVAEVDSYYWPGVVGCVPKVADAIVESLEVSNDENVA